jgi:hypothetical protein
MELMQLEMFVKVYEERSFKRAAEKVYRTQPAVSLAIAKLEKEVGGPLLVRRRGRRIDPPGEVPRALLAVGAPIYTWEYGKFGEWVEKAYKEAKASP